MNLRGRWNNLSPVEQGRCLYLVFGIISLLYWFLPRPTPPQEVHPTVISLGTLEYSWIDTSGYVSMAENLVIFLVLFWLGYKGSRSCVSILKYFVGGLNLLKTIFFAAFFIWSLVVAMGVLIYATYKSTGVGFLEKMRANFNGPFGVSCGSGGIREVGEMLYSIFCSWIWFSSSAVESFRESRLGAKKS